MGRRMLIKLRLENFRCFNDHTINCKPTSIIAGKNNAGKSTIVEALRLVSIVTNSFRTKRYQRSPKWFSYSGDLLGVSPSLERINLNLDTTSVFFDYGDPPATITATYDNGLIIEIEVGPNGEIFGTAHDERGKTYTKKEEVSEIQFPQISILPQIGPLLRDERVLREEYVRYSLPSHLASLHFRNQIHLLDEHFDVFKQLSESSWPGLQISPIEVEGSLTDKKLSLFVRDGSFWGEIGCMGHGLQMWLQTMWFLARCQDHETIILDEPDVYMHADLQRRLIRLIRGRHPQIIIATHSVEILSDVKPDQILLINRMKKRSKFANNLPAVQEIITRLGGVHNIHLARLWSSKRLLLLEGKDNNFLSSVQNILFPNTQFPFGIIPNFPIEGWGGWNNAVGSRMLLTNSGGNKIITYCILDPDYHAAKDIQSKYAEARSRNVQLHIWSRKEIENYFIIPDAIYRYISSNSKKRSPSVDDIGNQVLLICNSLKTDVDDYIATSLKEKNGSWSVGRVNKMARAIRNDAFSTIEGILSIVPGKEVLTELSNWSFSNFGVRFHPNQIAQELTNNEIHPEVEAVVSSIESGRRFQKNLRDTYVKYSVG